MNEQQKIRDEIKPILEELHNVLFSDKYFTDDKLHPIKEEIFNDLYNVYKKYIGVYNESGYKAFNEGTQYTDTIDSI